MTSIHSYCKNILDYNEIKAFKLEDIDSEKCSSRVFLRITENTIHYFKTRLLPPTFGRLYDNHVISNIENIYEDNKKIGVEFCLNNNAFKQLTTYLKSICQLKEEEIGVLEQLIYYFGYLLELLHIKNSEVLDIISNEYFCDRYFTLGSLLVNKQTEKIFDLMKHVLSKDDCRSNSEVIKTLFNINLLYKAYPTELKQFTETCSAIYNLKDKDILAYKDIVFIDKAGVILIGDKIIDNISKSYYEETIKDNLGIPEYYSYNDFRNALWILYQSIKDSKENGFVTNFRKTKKDDNIGKKFYEKFGIEEGVRETSTEYFDRKYYGLLRKILKESKSIYSDD